jgi:hypothetical protein
MSQLFGLFSNQKEASKAVEALAAANLNDSDIHTFDKENVTASSQPEIVPNVQMSFGIPTSIGAPVPTSSALALNNLDDNLQAFIQRGLQRGGVVVSISPSDEESSEYAERILKEQGGQVLGAVA